MEYKLIYFNARGLAEPIRFMLHYMGQEFEDIRIEVEDWPKYKNDTPFGKLPILQIGSEKYTDSVAIYRYLAHQAGLAGSTPKENLVIDQMSGALGDLLPEFRKVIRAENEEAKEKAKTELINVTLPFYFERFEKILKDNGGYLANGKLSWVDFYFIAWSETLASVCGQEVINKYPHYKVLKEKVLSLPGIKEWIKRRPETPL